MSFAFVSWTTGLLGLGISLLVVLGLYLLKPPPRAVLVPSTLLWQRLLEEQKPRNRWLRWLLSLLLSSLVIAALVLALTGLERDQSGSQSLVLVVDTSATMGTRSSTEGSAGSATKTRFELAQRIARARLEAAGERVYLGDTSGSLAPRRLTRAQALIELAGLEVHPSRPARMPAFPPDLEASDTDLVVITDGVGLDLDSAIREDPRVADSEVVSVFSPAINVGITGFSVAPVPSDAGKLEAFLEVVNGSPASVELQLRVTADDGPVLIDRGLVLESEESWTGLLDLGRFPLAGGVPLIAEVRAARDSLEIDDRAWALPPEIARQPLVVISEGERDLFETLSLHPRFDVRLESPEQYQAREPGAGSSTSTAVLIFDRWAPDQPPPAAALLIQPPARDWLPPVDSIIGPVTVASTRVDGDSSAGRGIGGRSILRPLSDLEIDQLTLFRPPEETILLGSAEAPILFGSSRGSTEPNAAQPSPWLVLPFAPAESNLTKKVEYPILIASLIERLAGSISVTPLAPGVHLLPSSVDQVRATDSLSGQASQPPAELIEGAAGAIVELSHPGLFEIRHHDRSREALIVGPLGRETSLVNATRLEPRNEDLAADGGRPGLRTLLLLLVLGVVAAEVVTQRQGWTE